MGAKLLLAGGGHAHMMTLANLPRFRDLGIEVTVVQPSPFHYYSGMGPGMLGGTYTPEEIRFATRDVVEKAGGTFVLDRVVRIEPDCREVALASGGKLSYDVLSLNIGSSVPEDILGCAGADNIFTVKPIERLEAARDLLIRLGGEGPVKVAVIGGGPSGVEIAGNVQGLAQRKGLPAVTIRLFARSTVMHGFPDKIRYRAIRSLRNRGVDIVEHCQVRAVHEDGVELESRQKWEADVIFIAVGVTPSPVIRESGLRTGPDGGLLVNRYLQSVDHPDIFGGGDCISFQEQPLDKVGVYAVRENPVLLHNLMAALEGRPLKPFDPGGDYLLIFNLGDDTGILRKKCLLFGGRPAFLVKDYIDRRFMRKFQALER
ncbi:MAG: FAD-dependent oxidoreductase [Desulfobulbaceae bacterium]